MICPNCNITINFTTIVNGQKVYVCPICGHEREQEGKEN